jgi:hypothetical protein
MTSSYEIDRELFWEWFYQSDFKDWNVGPSRNKLPDSDENKIKLEDMEIYNKYKNHPDRTIHYMVKTTNELKQLNAYLKKEVNDLKQALQDFRGDNLNDRYEN